jgi:glycosyltransferase involved in cell wall biosynthesis
VGEAAALPSVSVVVPVRNGGATIGACVRSLLEVDAPGSGLEIIVVDNGSTDATASILRGLPVHSLHEPRRGAARARNAGIRAAGGDIIAFTDADCVVSRGWLGALAEPLAAGAAGVAGEIVAYPPRTAAERYAARTRHLAPQKYLARPMLPFAVFANLAFRREVFDRVGLLDEAMAAGESTEFCTRFRRGMNAELVYAPRAVVFHRHRATARALFRQQWDYGRGHALLYIKYREEIPWGLRQSGLAYLDLLRAAGALAVAGLARARRRDTRDELAFRALDCVKKLAERLGFAREALARGYPYV